MFIYSFCFCIAKLNVEIPSVHKLHVMVGGPVPKNQVKHQFLFPNINNCTTFKKKNKKALSELHKVPFANDYYTVWAGQFFMHAA